jgi:hypothetical protein
MERSDRNEDLRLLLKVRERALERLAAGDDSADALLTAVDLMIIERDGGHLLSRDGRREPPSRPGLHAA